jgi:hypothetical protein
VIAGKLRSASAAHDLPFTSDFSRMSRFIAAGQARRGTRTIRLLAETVSGLRAARRRGPALAPDTPNGQEIKKMRRTVAILWAAAVVFALLARTTTGVWRPVFALAGALLAVAATAVGVLTLLIDSLLRTDNR